MNVQFAVQALPSPSTTMASKTGGDHISSEAKSLMDGKDALSALTTLCEAPRRDHAHTAAATSLLLRTCSKFMSSDFSNWY